MFIIIALHDLGPRVFLHLDLHSNRICHYHLDLIVINSN